jgi:hypothetical protein
MKNELATEIPDEHYVVEIDGLHPMIHGLARMR